MKDDNNPIKENNRFRIGIDSLDDEINATYEDMEPFSDLHECSNDLSDYGSRQEEIAHAKYAESKRRSAYSNYSTTTRTSKVILTNRSKWIVYFIIFMFIFFPILEGIFGIIGFVLNSDLASSKEPEVYNSSNYDYNNYYDDNYSYDDNDYDVEESNTQLEGMALVEEDVSVNATVKEAGTMNVEIENLGTEIKHNLTIQIILYNSTYKPIKIVDIDVKQLVPNIVDIHTINDIPEGTAHYDFIVNENK